MSTPAQGPSGGLSLFPSMNTSKPPSRKTTPRPRAGTPQSVSHGRGPSLEMTPPRNRPRTPENLSEFVIDGSPPVASSAQIYGRLSEDQAGPSAPRSPPELPPREVPPRSDTAFSGATLVRGSSNRSRSSIAKRPLDDASSPSPAAETGLRSMFPQYDHSLPFDRQDYYPTQTSPRHIPREVISRQSHVPDSDGRSPHVRSPVRSPLSAGSERRWPRRPNEPPVIPPVSKTEELRDYWKAANGWRASSAEGRKYCMKLNPEKDTPIYTLSSASQPFYHMRIDPTSASAYITLSRHDPSKPCKEPSPSAAAQRSPGGILGALREPEARTWQEAITTTLEEPSRRLPPNDGLVALIYPTAATKMALERPDDVAAVLTAERECARLVWDEDSANYFLAHPALATPFCVTIERNTAWSRTEYALEHVESPDHLARLTRDGTGEGHLELDSLVAGRVEAHYLLDVAVCALMVVAHLDEKNILVEQFEPPPMLAPPLPAHLRADGHSSSSGGGGNRSSSRLSSILGRKDDKSKRGRRRAKMEEFELDIESQTSSIEQAAKGRDRDKLPSTTRTVIKLLGFGFKCVIWALTISFKALVAIVKGLSKCLTSDKL